MERPLAGEGKRRSALLQPVVLGGVVGDVLADSLLAGAVEVHDGRLAQELGAGLQLQALERVPVDAERKVANGVVEAHRAANATDTSPASRAFATASARLTSRVRPPERSWSRARTKGVTACPDTP